MINSFQITNFVYQSNGSNPPFTYRTHSDVFTMQGLQPMAQVVQPYNFGAPKSAYAYYPILQQHPQSTPSYYAGVPTNTTTYPYYLVAQKTQQSIPPVSFGMPITQTMPHSYPITQKNPTNNSLPSQASKPKTVTMELYDARPITKQEQDKLDEAQKQIVLYSGAKYNLKVKRFQRLGYYNPAISFAGTEVVVDEKLLDEPLEVMFFVLGHEWGHNVHKHNLIPSAKRTSELVCNQEDEADKYAMEFLVAKSYSLDKIIDYTVRIYSDGGTTTGCDKRIATLKKFYDDALKKQTGVAASNENNPSVFFSSSASTTRLPNQEPVEITLSLEQVQDLSVEPPPLQESQITKKLLESGSIQIIAAQKEAQLTQSIEQQEQTDSTESSEKKLMVLPTAVALDFLPDGVRRPSAIPEDFKKKQIKCKDTLVTLLDNYMKNRSSITDSNHKVKEYFYGGFFAGFQKSYTQKRQAITSLISAVNGESVHLLEHLSTLRNGYLGQELRAFIKAGKADGIVGKKVCTVTQFVQQLNSMVNRNGSDIKINC